MIDRVFAILVCASVAWTPSIGARAQSSEATGAPPPISWSSPSLSTALLANDKWGIGNEKRVERVTDGVYAMRGWGLGSSFAVEAPAGWIIIDTGDYTQAAVEMRAMLEQTLGRKVKVAAILLTHWHYGNGTGAWLDEGTEIWGHEYLDRNRNASGGISVPDKKRLALYSKLILSSETGSRFATPSPNARSA